jgi:hypothetical protein
MGGEGSYQTQNLQPFNAKGKTISALHHKRSMHIFKNMLFQMATIKWYVCQILDEVSTNGVKMGFFNELAPK